MAITVVDDYAWLKDANWQEVLRDPSVLDADVRKYLEEETTIPKACSAHRRFAKKRWLRKCAGGSRKTFQRARAGWSLLRSSSKRSNKMIRRDRAAANIVRRDVLATGAISPGPSARARWNRLP